jgi:RND family efflux transporter MFP subunit
MALLAAVVAAAYPSAREYLAERRAPEVEVARATQVVTAGAGAPALPVLVATGYVVARHSSDVGVKTGGRIQTLSFEEGTRVRAGQVIASIEHADLDAQLAAARTVVAESETQLVQAIATRDEDARQLERQRALARDGLTAASVLSAAEATAAVSAARVKSAEAAIASARARIKVSEEALENTNVRAPFDGVVIRKRAEVGETVSPFGVAGQAAREGGAIATIADLRELEVQTEVNENNVAKLRRGMPAAVKVQAYQDREYRGRVREIFPSADRAKAIVEVRVSIVNPDAGVKPEMSASVTFEEPRPAEKDEKSADGRSAAADSTTAAPVVLIPRRAVTDQGGKPAVWIVAGHTASRRDIALGADRLDQVEVRSGVAPGEAVVLNPGAGFTDGTRVRMKGN